MSNSSNIDFVIPLHRYHNMVRTVIEAIQLFYHPRNIYIITPSIYLIDIENLQQNNVIGIPEETFFMKNYGLYSIDIESLFNQKPNENSREFGWWYQQIIKLGACKQIENLSDPYIVWDSDLIPFKKWEIYPANGEPYKFAILQEKAKSQWNVEQYRSSLFALIKMDIVIPKHEGTFVPHHFVMYHSVLQDIYHCIENHNPNDKTWIHSIMALSHTYFRFSEYLMISSFMMKYYPNLLEYHPFQCYGKDGYRIRESKDFVEDVEKNCSIEKTGLSYADFFKYVENHYSSLPSYLQIEHI